jgi:hypothetical protein
MPEKTITLDELNKSKSSGAEFEFDPEVLSIERFGELIEAMKSMVSSESERIRADIARNQTNLEILATLQAVIRKQGQGPAPVPVDLNPIRELLEEIRAERNHEPIDYDFNILRSGPGLSPAVKIEARAIIPTRH